MITSCPLEEKIPEVLPSYCEIAQCARELWLVSGCPTDHDVAIWIEAERRLASARRAPEVAGVLIKPLSRHRKPSRASVKWVIM